MKDKQTPQALDRTIDEGEIAKFAAMAEEWWDADGKFRPLHRFNPVRITFLRDRIAARFGRDVRADRPFAGLSILDVGCEENQTPKTYVLIFDEKVYFSLNERNRLFRQR